MWGDFLRNRSSPQKRSNFFSFHFPALHFLPASQPSCPRQHVVRLNSDDAQRSPGMTSSVAEQEAQVKSSSSVLIPGSSFQGRGFPISVWRGFLHLPQPLDWQASLKLSPKEQEVSFWVEFSRSHRVHLTIPMYTDFNRPRFYTPQLPALGLLTFNI